MLRPVLSCFVLFLRSQGQFSREPPRPPSYVPTGCLTSCVAAIWPDHRQDPTARSDWEKPLSDLTEATVEAAEQLSSVTEDAGEGAGAPTVRFRLVLRKEGLAIQGRDADTDAQTVWDKPRGTVGPRSKLGREEGLEVDVTHQRKVWNNGKLELWLRLHGREERWLHQSCPNGAWEMAPSHNAAGLQTNFIVETNLRLLLHMIDRDPSAATMLMDSARAFAASLQPLSLFDSTDTSIDRVLQTMLEWLSARAGSADSEDDAIQLLVKLTVARGTLSAVVRLARLFGTNPEYLRRPGVLDELSKLWDVKQYELSAQTYFNPVLGSNEALLDAWEATVFASLSNAGLPGGQDAWAEQLTQYLQAGDSEAARTFVRENVTADVFAEILFPSAEQLLGVPEAKLFAKSAADLEMIEQQLHGPRAEHASVTEMMVLGYFLKQIDLLSQRIKLDEEPRGKALRAPVCLDATEAGIKSLVSQLQDVHGSIPQVKEPRESARRDVLTVLLRLLQLNIKTMAAAGADLSADCASELHGLVSSFLAISVVEQPHCLELCESCAELFAIGQPYFLRSPQAKLSTAHELIEKLLLNTQPSPRTEEATKADCTTFEPEPEPDVAGEVLLVPFDIDTAEADVVIDNPGSIRVLTKEEQTDGAARWGIGADSSQVMSSGRHAIQLSVAADSAAASPLNPQRYGDISLAIVRPDCDVSRMAEGTQPAWYYGPLRGVATQLASEAAEAEGEHASPETHQTAWIDAEHWWQSSSSALAGDRVGLLLDCDRGELIAVKNGQELGASCIKCIVSLYTPLYAQALCMVGGGVCMVWILTFLVVAGVVFDSLVGSFCFAVILPYGASNSSYG